MISIRIFSVILLALCSFLIYQGLGIKTEFSYEPLGPRPFPIIALILIALGAFSLFFFFEETEIKWPDLALAKKTAFLIVNLFAFAFLFEYLGFIFSSMIFIFLTSLIFKAKWLYALIFAILASVLLYYLFDDLMQITLPAGQIFE
ncbi:tripartite tricarboxylate transporter TctB family protein [Campylobacter cuniculorum]|uniref:Tripartite tricarboxylate transporter TctB family protein n=2 Tax=Campylobacter cuniculorum TaxID=374106 RepID=A0ABX6TYI1_9BACT|nr:tripartite tricarboxylate transporter TctB family protein [Campylobacter cuniculorum]ARJ57270.1 putative tripartite tricarboxylate transport protein TctABC, membrane-spanning subunit TctB [Campylobacter cuniculorum DSM 23162 = LMG 24588]QOR04706.1 tripartite tricarboxylate transporter TctB family protein [Campylobacter cuniculorum]